VPLARGGFAVARQTVVGYACHHRWMEVSAERVAKIPAGNLHVSRAEFAEVWARAEAVVSRPGPDDHYTLGVALACEWLAAGPVPSRFTASGTAMPRSPVRRLPVTAHPEAIEDEWFAAVRRSGQTSVPWLAEQARGALALLDWAWHSNGRPPLRSVAAAG
jgi:hypothetical protein